MFNIRDKDYEHDLENVLWEITNNMYKVKIVGKMIWFTDCLIRSSMSYQTITGFEMKCVLLFL